ncbi:MAG: flavodoxin family protein, partial [Bacteroidota bacterium]
DAESLKRATELGRKLVSDVARAKKHPLQNFPGTLLNRFLMRPIFRKAILDHKDGMMKGVYGNLKERGLI